MIHCSKPRLYKQRNGCVLSDALQYLGSLFYILLIKVHAAAYRGWDWIEVSSNEITDGKRKQ